VIRLFLALALLAADAGAPPPPPPRPLEVSNLGAAPVTLTLRRADGSTPWGPFELGPHEVLHLTYCPCAGLTLELRTPRRAAPLRYPLLDQTAVLLSEDRWSEGDPIVRRATQPAACAGKIGCAGPDFHVGR
jgi:hypothetical protein